jgi:GTPase SAR1 family protein
MSASNHLRQGRMLLHKVVILGDGGVGKTAITNQFVVQYYVETVGSPLWYELRDESR